MTLQLRYNLFSNQLSIKYIGVIQSQKMGERGTDRLQSATDATEDGERPLTAALEP